MAGWSERPSFPSRSFTTEDEVCNLQAQSQSGVRSDVQLNKHYGSFEKQSPQTIYSRHRS